MSVAAAAAVSILYYICSDAKAPQIEEVVRTAGFPTKTAVCSSNRQPDTNELKLFQILTAPSLCQPPNLNYTPWHEWNEMKWNEGGLKLTDVLLRPITRAFRDLRSTPPVWLAIPFGGAKLDSRDAKAKCKPECWSPNSASIAARITSKACSTDSLVPPFMRSWSWWDLRCDFFFCSTCTWIWIGMFKFFVFSLSVYFNLIL